MLAFLKRWRQAYLEDKSNRLHAEAEAERNALCAGGISFDEAVWALDREDALEAEREEAVREAVREAEWWAEKRKKDRYYYGYDNY